MLFRNRKTFGCRAYSEKQYGPQINKNRRRTTQQKTEIARDPGKVITRWKAMKDLPDINPRMQRGAREREEMLDIKTTENKRTAR